MNIASKKNNLSLKFILFIISPLIFSSCNFDERCDQNFHSESVGVFGLDTLRLNVAEKKIVKEYKWDTVKLISNANGNYYFDSKDTILKKSEGTWRVARYKTDGRCTIEIKQNNLSLRTGGEPFVITISPDNLSGMLVYFTNKVNKDSNH